METATKKTVGATVHVSTHKNRELWDIVLDYKQAGKKITIGELLEEMIEVGFDTVVERHRGRANGGK